MPKQAEFITGTCQQFLFSPKGGVEGMLVKVKRDVVQVAMAPDQGTTLARAGSLGKRIRLLAIEDNSPRTVDASHAVYKFESLADADGNPVDLPEDDTDNVTIKGVVAAVHYTKHGQPNGVVLEGGEFIHMRPHGMSLAGVGVGAKISATGALRMTVLGGRLLEARQVNKTALD